MTSSNKNIKKYSVSRPIKKTRDRDRIASRPRPRPPAQCRDRDKTEATKIGLETFITDFL